MNVFATQHTMPGFTGPHLVIKLNTLQPTLSLVVFVCCLFCRLFHVDWWKLQTDLHVCISAWTLRKNPTSFLSLKYSSIFFQPGNNNRHGHDVCHTALSDFSDWMWGPHSGLSGWCHVPAGPHSCPRWGLRCPAWGWRTPWGPFHLADRGQRKWCRYTLLD